MSKRAVVIGAGIGGLATASLLAARGYTVDVHEQNAQPGGKMQQYAQSGYRFDTGPSLLTMPFILEKLFSDCGEDLANYLTLSELSPLCSYFYRDGVRFDNYSDRDKTVAEINKFSEHDAKSYASFLDYSERLYQKTADAFLFNPLYDLSDLKKLNLLDFFGIDAFSTVSEKVDSFFESSYLRRFFKRFTTYNGSSPYQAPATLNVIPHVELNQGGYYVKGGLYSIAEALHALARTKGVTFHFESRVERIEVSGKRVSGVTLSDGSHISSDVLIANSDATDTILNLLPAEAISGKKRKKQAKLEPSCSGFVMLLGCSKTWSQLKHHNIFFSENYREEFDDIFNKHRLPSDPTIYVANTSYSDSSHAPEGGSNLFVLVNAPYTDGQDWDLLKRMYSETIIQTLEAQGLDGLKTSIVVQEVITPKIFLERYGSNRGSIYGTASNDKFSAFVRPRNKLRSLKNLYLVGGSTHPGGGIPLVVQSAFNAMDLLQRQ
jgi:phytoene desaturase